MYDGEWRRAAGAARAEVLGDDGTRLPPGDPVPAEFHDYLVSVACGASARAGVTDSEVDELLFRIAAYCGAREGE
jgi:4-carboxymuconolactone decarboxylase